jgi:hypothetical protein
MPWVVGIDEAGYGPNLGPLVQAAVALRLPDADPAGWETLRPVIRRTGEKDDGRLLIDDSKKVYTRGGLAALERGVLAIAPISGDVAELVRKVGLPSCPVELAGELWYDPGEPLPVATTPESRFGDFVAFGARAAGHAAPVSFGPMVASVVPAARFNRICDECGSKAAVLERGLVELLRTAVLSVCEGNPHNAPEPVAVLCDKLGGRGYYAALVQQALPDGWVVAERESAAESRYRIEGLGRPVTVTFCPRADCGSVPVALASMLCKYLREVCMRQFNRFWAHHVPGLRPTAGYPGDAKRFFGDIRNAMTKLGLSTDQVWRKR